jgi:drug/metabolite transporter (DMT)-like permease
LAGLTRPTSWETRRPLVPELALVAATCAYGATFKLVQDALDDVTPVGFILLRFTVGGLVLLPFAIARGWRRRDVSAPTADDATVRTFATSVAVFGVVGFVGYWFQNEGLQRTTTSNSAFITGLFVVFTPLIETVVTRRRPPRNVLYAVAVSVVGLFLLTGASFDINAGDALTLGCAFMFGIWIYLGGSYSQRYDPITLTAGQLLVFAALAAPVVLAAGGLGEITTQVVVAVFVTGILCSAVAFTLQLWGQRWVEPSRAAVILLFEPVVAGIVGYAVGERLGVAGYVGAAVILAGIVLAESASWRKSGVRSGEPLDRTVKEP